MPDSSPRDQLAALLRDHATPIPDDGYPGDEYDCCAEEVLKARWRPPARVIGKREDLKALPPGTIVLEACRVGWESAPDPNAWLRVEIEDVGLRWIDFGDGGDYDDSLVALPVIVLWQPEVDGDV